MSEDLPDYDEVTRLRLRLSHVEAQRDAFEAALRKEVLAVIREEIRKAQPKKMYDTKPDGTIYIVAEDEEIAALKADVEHVKFWNGQLKAENDRLKAEVERLTVKKSCWNVQADYIAQLFKAGDAMALFILLNHGTSVVARDAWIAAKEEEPTV